jgi:hypothetical protein
MPAAARERQLTLRVPAPMVIEHEGLHVTLKNATSERRIGEAAQRLTCAATARLR